MGGAAAGEGGGGRRQTLGFGLPGSGAVLWPLAIEEEGDGGGGGPAAVAQQCKLTPLRTASS